MVIARILFFFFLIKVLFLYKDKKQRRQAQRRIQDTGFRILPLHTHVQTGLCTNQEARSICLLNWTVWKFYAVCAISNYGSEPATLRSMRLLICIVIQETSRCRLYLVVWGIMENKNQVETVWDFSLLLEFIFLNSFAGSLIFIKSPNLLLYIFNYSSNPRVKEKAKRIVLVWSVSSVFSLLI